MISALETVEVKLEGKTITAGDLDVIAENTTQLTISNCNSKEWGTVGERICSLRHLTSLEIWWGLSGDALIAPLTKCQQLRELIMSKSVLMQGDAILRTREWSCWLAA